ncbi:MAG: TraB/GumN family protein, partial [Inhella sp.]
MKHTLRTTLSSIALSLGLFASAQAKTDCPPVPQPPTQEQLADGIKNAKDRGALWRISKDGRTSYLYGTLHVGQMAWAFPGPKLMQALRETQVLAVEVDNTAPTTQSEMQAAMAQ